MSPPDWPLVLDGDDSAAFEAALGLVGDDFELDDHLANALLAPEELQCNSVGEASVSSRALVRGDSKEMAVVDAFLDEFDAVEEDAEELNEWSPHLSGTPSPSESDSVSSASSPQTKVRSQASKRNRVRPKQELTKLRREENELSYKLRELRLEARQRVLTGTTSRQEGGRKLQTRKHSLVFWERAASRQAHQRERSEQENRRLRAQLQVYIRHSRQLQQALNRRLLGSQGSGLEFPRWALSIPTDNAVIFRKLGADVDAIYLSLDLSSASVPKQDVEEGHPTTTMKHGAGKTVIFEHNRTSIVPFELRTVHQALWGSLGRELKNSSPNHQRTAVEYSGDVLHTSASVMTEPKYNFFMQSQSVARKYKTSDYALVISKSIVKPIGSDCGLVLGAIMTETNIRVLTQVETDDGEPLTCISTRTTLSREVLEGRFAHHWGQPEEVEITRAIWTRTMDARDRKLEEFLLHT